MSYVTGFFGNGFEVPAGSHVGKVPKSPVGTIPLRKGCYEFWYKRTAVVNQIAMFCDFNSATTGITAELRYSSTDLIFYIYASGSAKGRYDWGYGTTAALDAIFPLNTWVHVAFTWDYTKTATDRIRLYIDNVISTKTPTVVTELTDPGVAYDNVIHTIGGFNRGVTETTYGASGIIDNIKIYDYWKTDFRDRFWEYAGSFPMGAAAV